MIISDQIAFPPGSGTCLTVPLAGDDGLDDRVHLLTGLEIDAINAAIAAGRPLLVRGEPGTGKSQLARAAARQLGRAFVQQVIDSRSESRDLLWTFDAVMRLADAQLMGSLKAEVEQAKRTLEVENYLHPGPLWWAFDWQAAERQRALTRSAAPPQPDGGDWRQGCVLLIDEIDKAESELPNGLLEALGARAFTPPGRSQPVRATGRRPLVVITSNEERELPHAFVRRCLVLRLAMPERATLIERGRQHFPMASQAVLDRAADLLFRDREESMRLQISPWPGQAEYFDMVRAVLNLRPDDEKGQLEMLDRVSLYSLKKYAGLGTMGGV